MNGADFVVVAGKWSVQALGPAGFRSAISRAYYGAFHLARDFIARHYSWRCKDENEHQWVRRHFQNCALSEAVIVGDMLASLHENRKRADYRLDDIRAESQNTAMICVERARDIERQLESFSADQVAAIQREMELYRARAGVR